MCVVSQPDSVAKMVDIVQLVSFTDNGTVFHPKAMEDWKKECRGSKVVVISVVGDSWLTSNFASWLAGNLTDTQSEFKRL